MHDDFYSVEWIRKDDEHNCWNQHTLTHRWLGARLALFEAKMTHGRTHHHFRIRKV